MSHQTFVIPDGFLLENSELLPPGAFLAYETFGTLNPARDNAILWPTCYGQRSPQQRDYIGKGKRFDPSTNFIITVNLLGNGLSFSPTTVDLGARYPSLVTYRDNAALQKLLLGHLGVQKLALIYGFSMGAMLALEWAVQFPEAVGSVVAVCGSAKTNPANAFFLRSLRDTLHGDGSDLSQEDCGEVRVATFARIYADWIFDQPSPGGLAPDASRPDFARSKPGGHFYDGQLYRQLAPVSSLQEFMGFWEQMWQHNWRAMEYNAVLETWLAGDVSANSVHNGDLPKALSTIQALVYLMPGSTDQYFVAEEIAKEAEMIPRAIFRPIQSPFGHIAEGRPENQAMIQCAIDECLQHACQKSHF